MADHRISRTDLHVGVGVRDAVVVQDQGVALHEALAAVGVVLDSNQAAVTGPSAVLGDRLGDDLGCRLGGGMRHLGSGVLVLARPRVGHREDLTGGLGPGQDDRRVLHGQPGSDVPVDPLHVPLGLHPGPLGNQVVDVR